MNDRINRPELPKGWTWTNLSEISDVNLGKTPNKAQYRNHGDYKIIKFRDIIGDKIDWDESDRGFVVNSHDLIVQLRELRERDVLVTASAHSSEHIGKKAVYVSSIPLNYNEVFFVGELLCIRADEEIVNPRIIYYYIISQDGYNSIQSHVRGVHLISSEARQIGIPLAPLPEQHRIVAKIEELFTKLDAGVEGLKKVKAQLKVYRQAVLKHAFEGKLTEEWREAHKGQMESASVLLERISEERKKSARGKYKELPILNTSDLPELPEGWVWTRLGEVIEKIALTGKKLKQSNYQEEGKFPVIDQGRALIGGYSDKEELEVCCELPVIIFGDHTKVAKFVDFNFIAGADGIRVMKPQEAFYPKLFYYFIQVIPLPHKGYARHFQFLEKSLIPLPPLPEQHQIVEEIERCFSVADAIEKVVEQSLKQAERLRQSILKRAFKGKLVPQDPTDEPAEKLLERIRAERARIEAEKKATGKTRRS